MHAQTRHIIYIYIYIYIHTYTHIHTYGYACGHAGEDGDVGRPHTCAVRFEHVCGNDILTHTRVKMSPSFDKAQPTHYGYETWTFLRPQL